ncbi:MAG TPA: hypothetical protein VGC60_14115 [Pyrinomonadaceae bacterium]
MVEIIVNLLTPKCGAHYNAEQEGEVATSAEFTTFYKKEKMLGETNVARLNKWLNQPSKMAAA